MDISRLLRGRECLDLGEVVDDYIPKRRMLSVLLIRNSSGLQVGVEDHLHEGPNETVRVFDEAIENFQEPVASRRMLVVLMLDVECQRCQPAQGQRHPKGPFEKPRVIRRY